MKTLRSAAMFTLLAGLFALTAGLVAACGSSDSDDEPTAAPETSTPAPTTTVEPTATNTPEPTPTPFDGEVASFRVSAFDVDSQVENIGLTPSGTNLDVPKGHDNVGWYGIYDRPGWGGNSVFSAHISVAGHGPGPFYNLADTEIGDQFVVVMADGTEYVYEAFSETRYHVDEIPMGELIDAHDRPDDEEWITLITCGGERVDQGNGTVRFLHRDVVVARLVSTNPGGVETSASQ